MPGWISAHPQRYARWNYYGSQVRHSFYGYTYGWFGSSWWSRHRFPVGGWFYLYNTQPYAWSYWWTTPTYPSLVNWFQWSAPSNVWQQPLYYDYGPGGNVYYENNNYYVNGQQVASAADAAASAAQLATVDPPASEQEAADAEWMPLGTFAVMTDEQETEPTRTIQLAVNRDGVVSGTLYNSQTDEAQQIMGRVDKQTQRVALRIGGQANFVLETGLYNLTKEEAPALAHFGTKRREYWLLVRLDYEGEDGDAGTGAGDEGGFGH